VIKGVPTRVWLTYHRDTLVGLGIMAGFAALAAIVGAILLIPNGPTSREVGVVTGFGMRETEEGSYRVMSVRIGDTVDRVRAPARPDCRVGDRVTLSRVPHWWGSTRGIARSNGKACSRPTDDARRSPLPQQ
tara:strand:- start:29889 stop:30284 length:396 start_codon:yes stop_codon:yes gene_type:complete